MQDSQYLVDDVEKLEEMLWGGRLRQITNKLDHLETDLRVSLHFNARHVWKNYRVQQVILPSAYTERSVFLPKRIISFYSIWKKGGLSIFTWPRQSSDLATSKREKPEDYVDYTVVRTIWHDTTDEFNVDWKAECDQLNLAQVAAVLLSSSSIV